MFGKIFNSDDFEDWMRCIGYDEERKNEQCFFATQLSNIFQLDAPNIVVVEELNTKTTFWEKDNWDEIKYKIKVDPNLGQEKIDQL
jgi:hypothetical protein